MSSIAKASGVWTSGRGSFGPLVVRQARRKREGQRIGLVAPPRSSAEGVAQVEAIAQFAQAEAVAQLVQVLAHPRWTI